MLLKRHNLRRLNLDEGDMDAQYTVPNATNNPLERDPYMTARNCTDRELNDCLGELLHDNKCQNIPNTFLSRKS